MKQIQTRREHSVYYRRTRVRVGRAERTVRTGAYSGGFAAGKGRGREAADGRTSQPDV